MRGSMVRRWAPLLVVAVLGCGALDVSDPTAIEDSELSDASGAELLRGDALHRLNRAAGYGAFWSGLLADEFTYANNDWIVTTSVEHREHLRPDQDPFGSLANVYQMWHEARNAATIAIEKLEATGLAAHAGEAFAIRGLATVSLAEDYCPGFPLHDLVNYKPIYGTPLTTDEVLARALADFDSALAHAGDSARVLYLARVGRGRTLLDLGRFADAAAAVSGVPTEYEHEAEYNDTDSGLKNPLDFTEVNMFTDASVADDEGGRGLNFVSATDPRVPTAPMGLAADGITRMYAAAKYPDVVDPIVLVSGIEARLIEAEAALRAGDPSWLAKLNDLRAHSTFMLDSLTSPSTPETQVALLFRERAFWLFGTNHRLGDLRRLIRHYGRDSESVFPTGAHFLGGVYGAATSLPFPAELETPYSPTVTGCTDE